MQEAIPYKPWLRPMKPQDNKSLNQSSSSMNHLNNSIKPAIIGPKGDMKNLVIENAVIVFGKSGCCMSHVVKRLLQCLGVNPAVYEINEEDEDRVVKELDKIGGGDKEDGRLQFPAVFIGGHLFGGLDRIMAAHITGELTPILKQAGALWL